MMVVSAQSSVECRTNKSKETVKLVVGDIMEVEYIRVDHMVAARTALAASE